MGWFAAVFSVDLPTSNVSTIYRLCKRLGTIWSGERRTGTLVSARFHDYVDGSWADHFDQDTASVTLFDPLACEALDAVIAPLAADSDDFPGARIEEDAH